MARVFIPAAMRKLTDGKTEVHIPGSTLREVIENLEKEYPGTWDHIMDEDRIKPGVAAVVGEQPTRQGLRHKIEDDDTEVHFVPAISGG